MLQRVLFVQPLHFMDGMSREWWLAHGHISIDKSSLKPKGVHSGTACPPNFMETPSASCPSCESLGFLGTAFLRHSDRLGTASSGPGLFICDLLVNSGNITVQPGWEGLCACPWPSWQGGRLPLIRVRLWLKSSSSLSLGSMGVQWGWCHLPRGDCAQ